MSIVRDLSVIALRQFVSAAGYGAGEVVVNVLVDRFTNHGEQLTKALQKANDRAWLTLESALAGPSLLDYVLKRADDRVIAENIRVIMDNQLKSVIANTAFSTNCLVELRVGGEEARQACGRTTASRPVGAAGECVCIAQL
jgi:hypothetical protein